MLTLSTALLAASSGSSVSTPSLEVLLGRSTSPGWAMVGLTHLTVDSEHDQDWFSHADPYASVTIQPGSLRFVSKVLSDSNSGDLSLHFYVPLSATSAEVEIHDEDELHREGSAYHDKIGSFTLRLPGERSSPTCTLSAASASGGCQFSMSVISQQRDWWWRLQDVTVGSMQGYVTAGDEATSRAVALNAEGVVMVEAWTPVLDANSADSYWARLSYAASQARYLVSGMYGDEAGRPGSGIWSYLETRAYDANRLATGPGADTTSVIGNAYAREAMEALGGKLESNDRFRRNELGTQFMNEVIWPEKASHSIALGDSALDHAKIRPLLDKLVGPAMSSSAAIKEEIIELAEAFWFGVHVETDSAVQIYTQKLLHKFMLGLVLSQAEAEEFIHYKSQILIVSGGPASAVCTLYDCDEINLWKAGRLTKYQAALEAMHPSEMGALSVLEGTKATSAVLDALLFAGGVSVPSVIKTAFAVLYGEYGHSQLGADFELEESQVKDQVRSGQVRSDQVRSGQVRSGQVRSGQVRSGQVRSGQVRSEQSRADESRAEQSRAEQKRREEKRREEEENRLYCRICRV